MKVKRLCPRSLENFLRGAKARAVEYHAGQDRNSPAMFANPFTIVYMLFICSVVC